MRRYDTLRDGVASGAAPNVVKVRNAKCIPIARHEAERALARGLGVNVIASRDGIKWVVCIARQDREGIYRLITMPGTAGRKFYSAAAAVAFGFEQLESDFDAPI